MKAAAFIGGASDREQKRQKNAIEIVLSGLASTTKWFIEAEKDIKRDAEDRTELKRAVKWCRSQDAAFVISSCSDLFLKRWQALTYLKHQVEMYDMQIIVADDPTISKGSIHVLSAAADVQRNRIAEKSKRALEDIKAKLERDGSYIAKSGREVTRLGVHDKLTEAGVKGNEAQSELAAERDAEVWPLIERFMGQGMGYAGTARQLNAMGVDTPSTRARHDRPTAGVWYASTVRNIVLRRKVNGKN